MALVQLKENEGNYNDAVSLLVDYDKRYEALECAQRYEDEGQMLREDLLASTLAVRYAKMCERHLPSQKSQNQLVKFIKFMADPMDCVYYLKVAKKHHEAYNILCSERKFDEACRICAAQGWVDEGLKLAETKKNEKWTLQFIYQKAITSLVQNDKIDSSTITKLRSLTSKNTTGDQIRANAWLLLGKSNHDFFECRKAFTLYISTKNTAGSLEAFNSMSQFCITGSKSAAITIEQVLDACSTATDTSLLLNNVMNKSPLSAAQEHKLSLLEEFYGLQRHFSDQDIYFVIPGKQIWIMLYGEHGAFDTDYDGMIKIDSNKAMKAISSHVQTFLKRWKENDELQVCQLFHSRLSTFRFHKQLEDKGCVKTSFKMAYPGKLVYAYLKLCYLGLEISEFGSGDIDSKYIVELLLNFCKPAATLYLGVTKGQMESIAKSPLAALLEEWSVKTLQKSDYDFHVDDWLEAWAILSILGKDRLLRQLNKCTAHARTLPKDKLPAVYRYDKSENAIVHIFSMWIRSCILIQEQKKVITSTKVCLHLFLKAIARQKNIRQTLSITNLVNILTIHTTALLALTTLCNVMQQRSPGVFVPISYERVLNIFDNIGRQANMDSFGVLDACINDEKVVKAYEKMKVNQHAIQNIQTDITDLLWQILDMLLGRLVNMQFFHPFVDAMRSQDCIKRGETRHCLLLILVLFGNLTEIDKLSTPSRLQVYHCCINEAFESLKDVPDEECQKIRKAFAMFSTSSNTTGFFIAINHLINTADSQDYITRISARMHPWRFEWERAQMARLPSRPLLLAKIQPAHDHMQAQESNTRSYEQDSTSQFHLEESSHPDELLAASLQHHVMELCFKSPVAPLHVESGHLRSSVSGGDKVSLSDVHTTARAIITANEGSSSGPHVNPTNVVTLKSQASVEPPEENLEDLYEELKNSTFTLSALFKHDKHNSQTIAEESKFLVETDPSMLDDTFCRYCGIPLTADNATETIAEGERIPDEQHETPVFKTEGDEVIAEAYESHCIDEKHVNNLKAYNSFTSLKRNFYEPLKEKLHEVLQDLRKFEEENITAHLRAIVQAIQKELEGNEGALKHLMYGANWKMGASLIEREMLGRMDKLIVAAAEKLFKEQERVQKEQHLHEQAASTGGLDRDDGNLSGDSDGNESEEEISKNVDPIAAKEKEKQRKRANKKARKQRRKQQ